jgi:hypothetical protein
LDFEEFVELAAMKLVEKWAAKGGKAFLQDDSGGNGASAGAAAANQLKTNARRQLSVGEIMGEVMDNKKNEAYQRAKAKFHVEEILLVEEAFVSLAEPPSRRGRCKLAQLGLLCLRMGLSPRDRDVAVLAAEMDPLDTRVFRLPDLVQALASLQGIWRKVTFTSQRLFRNPPFFFACSVACPGGLMGATTYRAAAQLGGRPVVRLPRGPRSARGLGRGSVR